MMSSSGSAIVKVLWQVYSGICEWIGIKNNGVHGKTVDEIRILMIVICSRKKKRDDDDPVCLKPCG
jgi:hypothetical protein